MDVPLKQRAILDPAAEARPVGEGRRRSIGKGTRAHSDDLAASAKRETLPGGGLPALSGGGPAPEVRGGGGGGGGGAAVPPTSSHSPSGGPEPRGSAGLAGSPSAGAPHGWGVGGGRDRVPAGTPGGPPAQRPMKGAGIQGKGEAAVAMAVDPGALPPQAAGNSGATHKAVRGGYAQLGGPAAVPGHQRRPMEAPGRRHLDTMAAAAQRHQEEVRAAKKAAIQRALSAGATGHFKACDSFFGNPLVPVIPVHFLPQSGAGGPFSGTSVPLGKFGS